MLRDFRPVDWLWQPALWRQEGLPELGKQPVSGTAVAADTRLYHDGKRAEIAFDQTGQAPGALGLDLKVGNFDGSYVSLAIDLPAEGLARMTPRHLADVALRLATAKPISAYVRLNLQHGPNTAQPVAALAAGLEGTTFDLAYCGLTAQPIRAGWVELIFDFPAHNQITLTALSLAVLPRAEI